MSIFSCHTLYIELCRAQSQDGSLSTCSIGILTEAVGVSVLQAPSTRLVISTEDAFIYGLLGVTAGVYSIAMGPLKVRGLPTG